MVDIHVHLRTPGQSHKEDFLSGTKAAIAGGFTTILDMPNNAVPIKTSELLDEKIKIAKDQALCDLGFYAGSQGDNLEQFNRLEKMVLGIKLYLNETTGNFLIDAQTLAKIFDAWLGGPILTHAEDDAIAEVIKQVKRTGKKAHFCHISLQSDLEQIMEAKDAGLPVTCGVTPHHLFLTREDAEKLGPYGRMKPFLKSSKDVAFLWKHLGEIDVIESDHAPHTKEEKESSTPPFGVPGLETTLPLLLTAVGEGKLELKDIVRLCYESPKKILNLPGQDSRVDVDENEEYVIKNEDLFTKCGWTPFMGKGVKGKVKKVTLRGKTVFENGEFLAKPGFGKIVLPRV
ncbi:MAG: dihydroorotase [Candidatus Levyibacteriota bacterium]